MSKKVSNQIMLITYPDSLGKNLKDLDYVLSEYLQGAVYGVHILPFFPSSGDRGFAPITYDMVEPAFGDWEDIARLSEKYYLMCDYMINHMSAQRATISSARAAFSSSFLNSQSLPVLLGFLLMTSVVCLRLHLSKEPREALQVQLL